jgi:hypothetical protein
MVTDLGVRHLWNITTQSADTILLNALAAILVWDTDIVAAAATYSVSEIGDIEVIAVEESPPAGCAAGTTTTNDTYLDEPDFKDILFPKDTQALATVANPRRSDNFFGPANGLSQCTIVNSGVSHLSEICYQEDQLASNIWRHCFDIK